MFGSFNFFSYLCCRLGKLHLGIISKKFYFVIPSICIPFVTVFKKQSARVSPKFREVDGLTTRTIDSHGAMFSETQAIFEFRTLNLSKVMSKMDTN